MKYRKKPIVIEAFKMGIDSRPDWFTDKVNTNEIITYSEEPDAGPFDFTRTYCDIKTLEGVMRGDYGDYIIKGIKGEVYPCKPDIFESTYEAVEEEPSDKRWDEAVNNAIFMLDEYKKVPFGVFGATMIAQTIARYQNGERTPELLEELEGIQ